MSALGVLLGILQDPTKKFVLPSRKRKRLLSPSGCPPPAPKLRRSRRTVAGAVGPATGGAAQEPRGTARVCPSRKQGRARGLHIDEWPLRLPALRVPRVGEKEEEEEEGLQWITLLARRDKQDGAYRVALYDLTLEGMKDSCEGLSNPYFVYSADAARTHPASDIVQPGCLYASPSTGDATWTEVPLFDHLGYRVTDLYARLEAAAAARVEVRQTN